MTEAEELERAEETPAIPANPVTIEGDVWILGNHRIICGDSTKADAVERVTCGCLVDLCFTSPPYGRQRKYGFKDGIDDWDALMQGVFSLLPTKMGAQVLVNLGLIHKDNEWQPYWDGWIAWMRLSGWRAFGWYVWDQGPGLPGDWNGRLAPSHEFIFHFNREAKRAEKTVASKMAGVVSNGGLRNPDGSVGGRTKGASQIQAWKIRDSVFRVMRHKGGIGKAGSHPAVFPVSLVKEGIDAYSKADDCLYEPFSGSGTTIIAAEMTGRHCYAIEINPAYVDVAVTRWQNFTGGKAALEGDGRTFDELKEARKPQEPTTKKGKKHEQRDHAAGSA